jgi:hypothetical protein
MTHSKSPTSEGRESNPRDIIFLTIDPLNPRMTKHYTDNILKNLDAADYVIVPKDALPPIDMDEPYLRETASALFKCCGKYQDALVKANNALRFLNSLDLGEAADMTVQEAFTATSVALADPKNGWTDNKPTTEEAGLREVPQGLDFVLATLGPHNARPGWGRAEALAVTVKFLEDRLGNAPCDDHASSCCVRCNAIFLARTVSKLLEADALRRLSQREADCTCHPDEAPKPCQHKYALSECVKAAGNAAPPHPDSAREMALCCDCMFPDDCPGTSGGKCKLRFFIEHGVIHDSVTGKHVRTCDCVPGDGGGVTETCALLNELTLRSPDRAPGQGENDELVKELREAQHGWPISTAMYRLLKRAADRLSRADSADTAEQKK